MEARIPVNPEILKAISKIDQFRGIWAGGTTVSPDHLAGMRQACRVHSVGASCRIAGIRSTESDVAAVLAGRPSQVPQCAELVGYAAAMDRSFPASSPIVTLDELAALNAVVLGKAGNPPPPSVLRETPLHLEVFDDEGRAMGRVLQTLPPRLLQDKIEDLVSWLELELRGGEQHPLLVAGTFFIYFSSISPFERGNGRTARVILPHLIRRAGYAFVDYASLERVFDELRFVYYDAIDGAETKIWTDEADISPWISFFIGSLQALTTRLQAKLDLESRARELPPLQRAILDAIRENGTGAASLLMAKTGANRNTLKDNLRRLVDRGLLERSGSKRGTVYRVSPGESQDSPR
jgi:hypothetical protein